MIKLKDILKEVGEGVAPYPFKLHSNIKNDSIHSVMYTFTTEDGDVYIVNFRSDASRFNVYSLEFYPTSKIDHTDADDADDNIDIILNKGRMFKVMSTLIEVVLKFISSVKSADQIKFTGVYKKGEMLLKGIGSPTQRDNLYKQYLVKNIGKAPGWKLVDSGVVTRLIKTTRV